MPDSDLAAKPQITPTELAVKRAQEHQRKLDAARSSVDPVTAQKLAFAQKRLAAVQARKQSFDVVHPEYQAERDAAMAAALNPPMSTPKKVAIVLGVLGVGVASFFAYRRYWK